jgi:hypothetical protein
MQALGNFINYMRGGGTAPESQTPLTNDQKKVQEAAPNALKAAGQTLAGGAPSLETRVVKGQAVHPLEEIDPQLFSFIQTKAAGSNLLLGSKELGKIACLIIYAAKNFNGKAILAVVSNKDGRKKLTVLLAKDVRFSNISNARVITRSATFKSNRAAIVAACELNSERLGMLEIALQATYDALPQ